MTVIVHRKEALGFYSLFEGGILKKRLCNATELNIAPLSYHRRKDAYKGGAIFRQSNLDRKSRSSLLQKNAFKTNDNKEAAEKLAALFLFISNERGVTQTPQTPPLRNENQESTSFLHTPTCIVIH